MFGACIGDIIGSIYEWHNIKTKVFPLFQENCHYTDDTVMTCAIAKAVRLYKDNSQGRTLQELSIKEMRGWGRNYNYVGYGKRFRQWLESDKPRPYKSYGNGAAMRVSPVAWYADSLTDAEEMAKATAEVTHNHPEGIKGAVITAGTIYLALHGESKHAIHSYVEEKGYSLDFTLDKLRPDYFFDVSCQGSVPQAIKAFLESTSYEDAVRNAISIGGDSDTIAAIAGSIAEAFYGIPDEIMERGQEKMTADMCDLLLFIMNQDLPKRELEMRPVFE